MDMNAPETSGLEARIEYIAPKQSRHFARSAATMALGLALAVGGSGCATSQSNYDAMRANRGNVVYTSENIPNPLRQLYGISPEIAAELAKIPAIRDGVDAAEARAIDYMAEYLTRLNIPPDLFKDRGDKDSVYQLMLEWTGNGKKVDWNGTLCIWQKMAAKLSAQNQ